jgi:hypothetical protein
VSDGDLLDGFLPGTPVNVSQGERVPIERIRAGDTVITYTGTPRKVLRTVCGPYEGEMVTIEAVVDPGGVAGASQAYRARVSATPTHWLGRVVDLESGGWVWCAAGNLRPGHVLRIGGGWDRATVSRVARLSYRGDLHTLEVDVENSFLPGGFDARNPSSSVARADRAAI